jgi:hypothetical protein
MFAATKGGETGVLSVRVQSTRGRTLLWSPCGATRERRALALREHFQLAVRERRALALREQFQLAIRERRASALREQLP